MIDYYWRGALCSCLTVFTCAWIPVNADSWKLNGFDRQNTNNSSPESSISKSNVDQLELKWIYNIDAIPFGPDNPIGDPRSTNSSSQGAVVEDDKAYFSLFDGRIITLSVDELDGLNPDGSAKPKLLNTFDLFDDPKYYGASDTDGDDVFMSRMPLSLMGSTIYAGNYIWFPFSTFNQTGTFSQKAMGTPTPFNPSYESQGAVLYAINKNSGDLQWKTIVSDNPQQGISAAGMNSFDGLVYTGVVNLDTGNMGAWDITAFPFDPYFGHCCDQRGAVIAVDKSTGEVVWKTYTVPLQNVPTLSEIVSNGSVDGWFGASVWGGGHFPISTKHKLIYASTGEATSAPNEASQCEEDRLAIPFAPVVSDECLPINQDGSPIPGGYGDSIGNIIEAPGVNSPTHPITSGVYAMDLQTGEVKWGRALEGFDVWNLSCLQPIFPFASNFTPFCPPYLRAGLNFLLTFVAKDRDAAEQPMLVEGVKMGDGKPKDVLLVGTKGANVYAFDAENGAPLWGPVNFGFGDISNDGIIWGSATDGKRYYSNTGKSSDITLDNLYDPDKAVVVDSCIPSGFDEDGNWAGGMILAIDIASGNIAWQRCILAKEIDANGFPTGNVAPGRSQAPVSVSNGVVIAPGATQYDPLEGLGTPPFAEVLLLDADTGELLRELPLSVPGQPSAQGIVYQTPIAVGNKIFIANGSRDGFAGGDVLEGNRIVVYELPEDGDEDGDNNNQGNE